MSVTPLNQPAAKLPSPPQLLDLSGFVKNLLTRRLWFIAFIGIDIAVIYGIVNDPVLIETWNFIWPGINTTLQITIWSFLFAIVLGLITALARISKNILVYNISTLYVELFRGLPLLVIVLIFGFVVTPAVADFVGGPDPVIENGQVTVPCQARIPLIDDLLQRLARVSEERIATHCIKLRDIDPVARIVFAFALTYGAFMSEVFRAGIESISRGQSEAARSLGMTYVQSMRYVILPQAVRNVLPAIANNFILLLKDTSLASVVAVPEISHLTRQYSSNRFRYPEGLLVLSFIYANLTIILSMLVLYLERQMQRDRRDD
jgi:polar amino acid transport system permease protein